MTWFLVLYLLFRCAAIPRWNFFLHFARHFVRFHLFTACPPANPFHALALRTDNHAVESLTEQKASCLLLSASIYIASWHPSIYEIKGSNPWPLPTNNHQRPDLIVPSFLHISFVCIFNFHAIPVYCLPFPITEDDHFPFGQLSNIWPCLTDVPPATHPLVHSTHKNQYTRTTKGVNRTD